ncbi:hypothetical protein ID866_2669 [Astraeus odoratus]|nr:hypothetical protein ID866_2669 [Astraeus odoratus]
MRQFRDARSEYGGHERPYREQWSHGPSTHRYSYSDYPLARGYNYWRGGGCPYPQNSPYCDPYAYTAGGGATRSTRRTRESLGEHGVGERATNRWRRHHSTAAAPSPPRSPPLLSPPIIPHPSPTYAPSDPEPPPSDVLPSNSYSQKDRSSPAPSPRKLAQPPKSDPTYLTLVAQPSSAIQDPTSSRKLLVLDLNGTLLIRAPRRARTSHLEKLQVPALRTVHPRPYIPAFRAYLFAPETRAWLDTMVWSSAQPHSVADMVAHVFQDYAGGLVAVWDRKSLGLTEAEYHRKTVTTKDLSKPWELLPRGLSPAQVNSGTSTPDPGRKVCNAGVVVDEVPSPTAHSALTTLLLDDSPHKAALQPYNHVCIPEYDSARRQRDLASLAAQSEPVPSKTHEKKKKRKRKQHQEAVASPTPDPDGISDSNISEDGPAGTSPPGVPDIDVEPFDVTLLGVVGILDEIKRQSNVAGWIRAGGLWGDSERHHGVHFHAATKMSEQLTSLEMTTDKGESLGKMRHRDDDDGDATSEEFAKAAVACGSTKDLQRGAEDDTHVKCDPATTAVVGEEPLSVSTWFAQPSTLAYWAARGRKALVELGIEVGHGVKV